MSGFAYQYVVIRLVPRVERQEFVNVGVVLYAQEAEFIDGAFHLDAERVRALAPHLDLGSVIISGASNFTGEIVSLDADGTFNCGDPTNVTCAGTPAVATYRVTGTQGQVVTINADDVTLTNAGGDTLTLKEEYDLWKFTLAQGAPRDLGRLSYSAGEKYSDYVRDASGGYVSVKLPVGDAMELSVRAV